ncbi:hypothetical protein ACET3Z_014224 [Daucus carota]
MLIDMTENSRGNDDHRLNPSLVDSISTALHHIRTESTATPSPAAALVTTGEGKFFSNGHDMPWVQYNKDRLLLLMSKATLKAKISSPAVLRDIVLKAEKMTAEVALQKGIIDAAYDTVEETVAAAVEMGEQLARRNWNGQVYAENRKFLLMMCCMR